MDHDRLFKELLTTFFVDFLEVFCPQLAGYLDPGSVEFLDKEVFTDVTHGDRHEVDLVAKARFRRKPLGFLIHVEAQARRQDISRSGCLRTSPVFMRSTACPSTRSRSFPMRPPREQEADEYRIDFPDLAVLSFRFRVVQLNQLDWQDTRNAQPDPGGLDGEDAQGTGGSGPGQAGLFTNAGRADSTPPGRN